MTDAKGLDPAVADKIGEYIKHKGGLRLLDSLSAGSTLMANKRAKEGVEEMAILFKYLNAYQVVDKVRLPINYLRSFAYSPLPHLLPFRSSRTFLRPLFPSR